VNGDAKDGSTGGSEVGPPPGAMEAAAGAMAEAALDVPPPGEMPPGGMPADQIEAPDDADEQEGGGD
jgi:hypothetical protein